jgi:hypothetical protein
MYVSDMREELLGVVVERDLRFACRYVEEVKRTNDFVISSDKMILA